MSQSAVVYKYADQSTGWVLRWGRTANQHISDAATQVLVPLNAGVEPDGAKPLWKQRVDAGVFASATTADKDAAKIWLASQFRKSRSILFQQVDPLVILDTNPVIVGSWMADSREGIVDEQDESQVFGAVFKWTNPVEIRPPEFVCRGYNMNGVEQHTLPMYGEALKVSNDPTTSYEFWKVVTAKNAPNTFRQWKLEISIPTLQGSESCKLESIRVSKGRRGAR